MRIVVISKTHRLLPFASRLQAEGADVQVFVTREHYTHAYEGILKPSPRLWQRPTDEPAVYLTDDSDVTAQLEARSIVPFGRWRGKGQEQSPIMFGGWWTGSELQCPHWAIVEIGAQHGNMGRRVPTSVALVAARVTPAWQAMMLTNQLPPGGRCGLVRVEVVTNPDSSEVAPGIVRHGWPDLHHQLLLEQQPSAIQTLMEGPQLDPGVVYFGTVLSVPPWPNPPTRASRHYPVSVDMPKEQRQHLVWHDVAVRQGRIETAALDGFLALGVARSRFLSTARSLVFGAARSLGIPELQVRMDAGELIESCLTRLELAQAI